MALGDRLGPGLLGSGIGVGMGQQQAAGLNIIPNFVDPLHSIVRQQALERWPGVEFKKKKPETLREELQLETDEWLKDTI